MQVYGRSTPTEVGCEVETAGFGAFLLREFFGQSGGHAGSSFWCKTYAVGISHVGGLNLVAASSARIRKQCADSDWRQQGCKVE